MLSVLIFVVCLVAAVIILNILMDYFAGSVDPVLARVIKIVIFAVATVLILRELWPLLTSGGHLLH